MMPDYLFEIVSEAGRKVGGIYTVLQSKASLVIEKFQNNYFLIGMYDENSAKKEFVPDEVPEDFKAVFEELEGIGIKTYYGRWKKGSNARLIMVDAREFPQEAAGEGRFLALFEQGLGGGLVIFAVDDAAGGEVA